MKSPKFEFTKAEIVKFINPGKLKWIWKKHIGAQLRKQLAFDLVEYKDIDDLIDAISRDVSLKVEQSSYMPTTPAHYLVEKSRGLCRQMTLVRPEDLLILQALSLALQPELDRGRPTPKAFYRPDDQRFSKKSSRLDAGMYGSLASWKSFQQAVFEFAREHDFIVVTDIANFYDFINFSHLRNIVASICDVNESILDLLIFILNETSWTPDYMPRTQIGLP